MKLRWRVLIGVVVVLAALLAINTIVLESQTKEAAVTIGGGKILHLSSGDVQVTDTGEPASPGGAGAQPIVLIHGYAGGLDWFDKLVPLLSSDRRVVRIDLLGFGGSEKPENGYAIEDQARLVAEALNKLGVQGALVVGHSMGAAVTASLAEQASELVDRAVIIDQAPDDSSSYGFDLPFLESLSYKPVLGEALWRTTPDFAIRDGLEKAFAPGFDLSSGFGDSDAPIEDFRRMTYTSYTDAFDAEKDFLSAKPLDERFTTASVPLMVIFGNEDQIYDAQSSLAAYDDVPGVVTATIKGAGHSPQVEKPKRVADQLEKFAAPPIPAPVVKSPAKKPKVKGARNKASGKPGRPAKRQGSGRKQRSPRKRGSGQK